MHNNNSAIASITDKFHWIQQQPELLFFMHIFNARIVGGAVRNTLLDLPITGEIDLATPFTPDEITYIADIMHLKHIPTGIEHGTITILGRHYSKSYLEYMKEILAKILEEQGSITKQPKIQSAVQFAIEQACKFFINNFDKMQSKFTDPSDRVYEFTTLRADVETDGRHAKIAFTKDWKTDAERRDFTINALYADVNGTVHDLINGLQDIYTHYIRFVGEPNLRIQEDYLRILRFFRFNAHYGSDEYEKWDKPGLNACLNNVAGLKQISQERIFAELYKMFKGTHALIAIELMDKCNIINTLNWPKINKEKMNSLAQAIVTYHKNLDKWNTLLSEAVFATFDGDWNILKMPKKTLQTIQSLQNQTCKQISDWYKACYKHGIDWVYAKILLDNVQISLTRDNWLSNLESLVISTDAHANFVFPVTGQDIIDVLECKPGPIIGQMHSKLLNWWLEGLCQADRDACLTYLKQLVHELH